MADNKDDTAEPQVEAGQDAAQGGSDEDMKRRFREALGRKTGPSTRSTGHAGGSAVTHAGAAAKTQRTFRRRAGG